MILDGAVEAGCLKKRHAPKLKQAMHVMCLLREAAASCALLLRQLIAGAATA